jgi:glycosyltransferase involved in cell wall biosynthesis
MPFIIKTIESILAQEVLEFEIIVSDDRSDDGTSIALSNLKIPQLRIVVPPKRLSAGQNWTFVSTLASGQYSKLICADDELTMGAVQRQLNALEKYPNAVACYSNRQIISEKGKVIVPTIGGNRENGIVQGNEKIMLSYVTGRNLFGEPSNILFRTTCLKNNLPWSDEFPYLLDMSLYIKAFKNKELYALKSIDSSFRLARKSISHKNRKLQSKQF